MGSPWSGGAFGSNGSPGAKGLNYIRRYASGEPLASHEIEAMRAAMYLLVQYVNPPRAEDGFKWQGPEHFIVEIWPKLRHREDVRHGFFGDGSKSP